MSIEKMKTLAILSEWENQFHRKRLEVRKEVTKKDTLCQIGF
jgi:hypothetical protein